jgi:hypothetical protein
VVPAVRDPRILAVATCSPNPPRGLRRVLRHDHHDRDEIWFVLEDGSNLVAAVADALKAIRDLGLPWFGEARKEAVREHEWRVRDGLV